MFEKDAEEYGRKKHKERMARWEEIQSEDVIDAFKDGAEFGYNKANEWHYVKDEGTPTKEGHYLVCLRNKDHDIFDCWIFVSDNVPYSLKVRMIDIYAWKEITPPKESE